MQRAICSTIATADVHTHTHTHIHMPLPKKEQHPQHLPVHCNGVVAPGSQQPHVLHETLHAPRDVVVGQHVAHTKLALRGNQALLIQAVCLCDQLVHLIRHPAAPLPATRATAARVVQRRPIWQDVKWCPCSIAAGADAGAAHCQLMTCRCGRYLLLQLLQVLWVWLAGCPSLLLGCGLIQGTVSFLLLLHLLGAEQSSRELLQNLGRHFSPRDHLPGRSSPTRGSATRTHHVQL